MSLHRLTSVTIGVPNVAETAAYYQAFGLTEVAPGRLATTDGGEQLILVESPRRRLVALGVGVDDPDDLESFHPNSLPEGSRARRHLPAALFGLRGCPHFRERPDRGRPGLVQSIELNREASRLLWQADRGAFLDRKSVV